MKLFEFEFKVLPVGTAAENAVAFATIMISSKQPAVGLVQLIVADEVPATAA